MWRDESACEVMARKLALRPAIRNACIELQGCLGAGKTTFARQLLRALGVNGRIKSPSYALMEPYTTPEFEAWHFDFYRFDDPREWEDAGFRELFARHGLKLVEWPENAAGLLPTPDLRVELEPLENDQRRVSLHAFTSRGLELLP